MGQIRDDMSLNQQSDAVTVCILGVSSTNGLGISSSEIEYIAVKVSYITANSRAQAFNRQNISGQKYNDDIFLLI